MFHDKGVQVEHPGRVDFPVAERQELAGERAGPLASRQDSAERRVQRVRGCQFLEGLRRVAVDNGEQVVEVVGHAARKPADGIHLLHLPQGLGRPKAFAGVAEHQDGPY